MRKALWVGMAAVVVSFWLPAVSVNGEMGGRPPGYLCALMALVMPWANHGRGLIKDFPKVAPVLLSGWINLAFLLWLSCRRFAAARWLWWVVLVLLLFPVAVFLKNEMSPRIGYFLWTAGILTSLFSKKMEAHHA